MNVTIERTDSSSDDGTWSRKADLPDVRAFFANPQNWMAKEWSNLGERGRLTDSFVVRVGGNSVPPDVPFQLRGSSHIQGEGRVTNLVELGVNREFAFPPDVVNATWTDVRTVFPSKFNVTITYTKSLDPTRGPVTVHMELLPDMTKVATLAAAIALDPGGLKGWMEDQTIVKERWVLPNGTFEDITRANADDLVTFTSVGTIITHFYNYVAFGENPQSSCNSDFGNYTGDPSTNQPTNIDIDTIELKMY